MRTKKSLDHVWERRRKSHRGAPKRLQHTPINILTSFGGGKQITKHKRRPNAFIHYFVDTFWSTEISQFSKKKILRRGPSPIKISFNSSRWRRCSLPRGRCCLPEWASRPSGLAARGSASPSSWPSWQDSSGRPNVAPVSAGIG